MRDRIGRSTLLFHKGENSIIISNILGRNYNCIEVPATHIQKLNLSTNIITLYQWNDDTCATKEFIVEDWLKELKTQQNLPDDEFHFEFEKEELAEVYYFC